MIVYCPKMKCGGMKEVTACLYLCPKATVLRCPEYLKVYPELVNYEVDAKYVEKYGVARIIIPPKYMTRRRRVPKCATTHST